MKTMLTLAALAVLAAPAAAQVRANPAAGAGRAAAIPALPASVIPMAKSYAGDPFHSAGSLLGSVAPPGAPTPIVAAHREHADSKQVLMYYSKETPVESLDLMIRGMKPKSHHWYNDGLTRFVTINAKSETQAMSIAQTLSRHPFEARILLSEDLFRRLNELFDGIPPRTTDGPGVSPLAQHQ